MGGYVDGRTKGCATSGGGGGTPTDANVEIVEAAFTFASGSPVSVVAVVNGDLIIDAEVEIDTVFDDPATTISLGINAAPSLILDNTEIDPTAIGFYGNPENFRFTGSDTVILTINPGVSTQGSGRIVLVMKVI